MMTCPWKGLVYFRLVDALDRRSPANLHSRSRWEVLEQIRTRVLRRTKERGMSNTISLFSQHFHICTCESFFALGMSCHIGRRRRLDKNSDEIDLNSFFFLDICFGWAIFANLIEFCSIHSNSNNICFQNPVFIFPKITHIIHFLVFLQTCVKKQFLPTYVSGLSLFCTRLSLFCTWLQYVVQK